MTVPGNSEKVLCQNQRETRKGRKRGRGPQKTAHLDDILRSDLRLLFTTTDLGSSFRGEGIPNSIRGNDEPASSRRELVPTPHQESIKVSSLELLSSKEVHACTPRMVHKLRSRGRYDS